MHGFNYIMRQQSAKNLYRKILHGAGYDNLVTLKMTLEELKQTIQLLYTDNNQLKLF